MNKSFIFYAIASIKYNVHNDRRALFRTTTWYPCENEAMREEDRFALKHDNATLVLRSLLQAHFVSKKKSK